jgi:hypothetical protein
MPACTRKGLFVFLIAVIPPLPTLSLSDQMIQTGIWAYLLIFLLLTFTSTIVGGAIPDNMILILIGASAVSNGFHSADSSS